MNMPLHHIFSRVKQVKHSETTIKYVSFHEYSIHIPYPWKSYVYFIDIVDTLFNHSHVPGIPIATIADSSFFWARSGTLKPCATAVAFPWRIGELCDGAQGGLGVVENMGISMGMSMGFSMGWEYG